MTSLVKKGNQLDLLKAITHKMHKQSVEVGHFQEQGIHGPSGMSYVQLLKYWYVGVERETGGRLRQDVRGQFIFNNSHRISKDPKIMSIIIEWFTNTARGLDSTEKTLADIGKILRLEYTTTFNVRQGPHMEGTVTPLFETGELAESTAYRTSKNPAIKER